MNRNVLLKYFKRKIISLISDDKDFDIVQTLSYIAKKHGIKKFIKVEPGDRYCLANGQENYENRSYIIGDDELELGIYKNQELMVASFFHELGHITDTKDGIYNSETKAWLIGFKLAKQYGFEMSPETYLWALEQLSSYDTAETKHKL